jgi:NDP-sugar pyrophosphorylase family protein
MTNTANQSPLCDVPAIILAGGLGTRLRSVVADRPKGLAPVNSRPFLEIQIELLRRQGFCKFVLCVAHFADMIREHFGDGKQWDAQIDYSEEGGRLLGTGGALKLAQRFFAPRALVLNGDTYFDLDYRRLVQYQLDERERAGAIATLALAHAPDGSRYGKVTLDESGRYLRAFAEKPTEGDGQGGWLSAGAYVIERELLEVLAPDTPYSLERDVFPQALADGRTLAASTSSRTFYDIGTPGGLRTFAEYYAELCDESCGMFSRP